MALSLPDDFTPSAVDRFDRLQREGKLYYFPSPGEVTEHNGFHFEFRISPSIQRKPVLAADAPERKGRGGPFLDPDPDFVVCRGPGPDHVVELSMHAMFRPHYVLHTRLFAPQTDDLDRSDLAASWPVVVADQHQMLIYNCGFDAGASQGHKHVQVFREPEPGFALFPSAATSTTVVLDDHPDVPFQHFVLRLRKESQDEEDYIGYLLETYHTLLERVRKAHSEFAATAPPQPADEPAASKEAYNVLLTPEWMCLIPRRHGGRNGTGTSSLGMLGLLWLRDEAERAYWKELGMTDHLTWMGLPRARDLDRNDEKRYN